MKESNKNIEVKSLDDIIGLELHMESGFTLDMYDKGDNTAFYRCDIGEDLTLEIILISEENLIENNIPLVSILTSDIFYMKVLFCDEYGDVSRSYIYRGGK